ncbi:hypothetical protein [Microbacterium pumilum]
MDDIVSQLLRSEEPSVRWRVRTAVLRERADDGSIRALQDDIRRSPRVEAILNGCRGLAPYAKWRGPHWALLALSNLGYPSGDPALLPLRDVVLGQWLRAGYLVDADVSRITRTSYETAVPRVSGRSRVHASQQGGALLAIIRLGLDDGRASMLAQRLCAWQWPDGGWNCDRDPDTAMSSVHETLLPMRGLAAYADASGDAATRSAAVAAAEVFLTRRVAWRRSSDKPLSADAVKLHYPVYWHFDVLAGLVGLRELDLLDDIRCEPALTMLESRRRTQGGWSADARYWRVADAGSNIESVSWGAVSTRQANEWVTADALAVLAAAGRFPST